MRYGIISDIHGNWEALKLVIKILNEEGINFYLCGGDLVGYGPWPNECVETVQNLKHCLVVAGNHDRATVGLEDIGFFNLVAKEALFWTRAKMSRQNKKYLRNLPSILVRKSFTLVHGSPRNPINEYLMSRDLFRKNLPYLKTNICFVAHTHIPFSFFLTEEGKIKTAELKPNKTVKLMPSFKYVINFGSVGQPRDGDFRASCGIYDETENSIKIKRVGYNISLVQEKMFQEGLPSYLIKRLRWGI